MRPSRAAKAHQHPAKPRVFGVLLGIIFPVYTFDIYRDAVMASLEHEPHEVQAKDIGAICVEAVRLGQRMLLAGCVFQSAIDYPRAHPSDAAEPRIREGTLRESSLMPFWQRLPGNSGHIRVSGPMESGICRFQVITITR
jgi:hypothetical protein